MIAELLFYFLSIPYVHITLALGPVVFCCATLLFFIRQNKSSRLLLNEVIRLNADISSSLQTEMRFIDEAMSQPAQSSETFELQQKILQRQNLQMDYLRQVNYKISQLEGKITDQKSDQQEWVTPLETKEHAPVHTMPR